jgi:hypothetical protein
LALEVVGLASGLESVTRSGRVLGLLAALAYAYLLLGVFAQRMRR